MSDRAFSRVSWASFVALFTVLYVLASCSGKGDGPDDATANAPSLSASGSTTDSVFLPPTGDPDELSAWNQVATRGGRLVLAEGVTPYALNSPLFSDYAHKLRTVWIPEGAGGASYDPAGPFDFPVGTVVTKTFYYPSSDDGDPSNDRVSEADPTAGVVESLALDDVRLVETRVLVRRDDGWYGLPYVWNAEETEATLQRAGAMVQLVLVDDDTEEPLAYVVPDVNQCASCHAMNHSTGAIETIGLQARHLNTEVDLGDGLAPQLDLWGQRGLLNGAPAATDVPAAAVWEDDAASLETRARAYIDINCAHCHNPVGAADTSGLFLDHTTEIGSAFGVCKPPVAAGSGTGGRSVDIYPGKPEDSILVHRLETTNPGEMMPELGRSLTHTEGVDLISAWIESLDGSC